MIAGRAPSRRKKFEVYTRDHWRCVECGSDTDLTIDHIRPKVLGGTNHIDNLQTMCAKCNWAKSDTWDCASEQSDDY